MERETASKLGKVQIALENLGKQINELERAAENVNEKTEPVRVDTPPEAEDDSEVERERMCPVANTIMVCCDRVEVVTKKLQGVLQELEV